MKMPRFYSAQSRFLGGLTLAAIVVGALFAAGFYLQIRQVLENEVRERAELILSQAESVQRYVRRVLRPRMYQEVPGKFIMEAMSTSFVSRSVMEGAKAHTEDLLYRRVAVNARNPQFEPTPRSGTSSPSSPKIPRWSTTRAGTAGTASSISSPPGRALRDRVHALPRRALRRPARGAGTLRRARLRAQGGERRGHGFRGPAHDRGGGQDPAAGDGLPAHLQLFGRALLRRQPLVFKRVVAGNLRGMAQVLRATADDDTGEALARQVQSRDEIAEMVEGVEKLSEHLTETRRQLRDYAATLEDKVARRTAELSRRWPSGSPTWPCS
jgi:hypothetical protein